MTRITHTALAARDSGGNVNYDGHKRGAQPQGTLEAEEACGACWEGALGCGIDMSLLPSQDKQVQSAGTLKSGRSLCPHRSNFLSCYRTEMNKINHFSGVRQVKRGLLLSGHHSHNYHLPTVRQSQTILETPGLASNLLLHRHRVEVAGAQQYRYIWHSFAQQLACGRNIGRKEQPFLSKRTKHLSRWP